MGDMEKESTWVVRIVILEREIIMESVVEATTDIKMETMSQGTRQVGGSNGRQQ